MLQTARCAAKTPPPHVGAHSHGQAHQTSPALQPFQPFQAPKLEQPRKNPLVPKHLGALVGISLTFPAALQLND